MNIFLVVLATIAIVATIAIARRRARGLEARMAETERAAKAEALRLMRLFADRRLVLERQHREMRAFLDHVGQGFLVVEPTGAIGPERSAIVREWFGDLSKTPTFDMLVQRLDPELAPWFELGWEALFDDFLPFDIVIDQLPKRLRHGARSFDLAYRPMTGGGAGPVSVLVVITDVTLELEKRAADAARSDTMTSLQQALRDPVAYVAFLEEAEKLLAFLAGDADAREVGRAIHTLKGSAGLAGLGSMGALCHTLEARLLEQNRRPSGAEIDELERRFRESTATVRALLATTRSDAITVSRAEHEELLDAVLAGMPRAGLAHRIERLALEPLGRRLDHVCEQVRVLARQQGKEVAVRHVSNGVRFEAHRWAGFWSSFAHVVRNAVDHGIASPAARIANGKLACGVIAFEGRIEDDCFVLRANDDGNGIDWEHVRGIAEERGLPATTQAQLEEALFADGLSTRSNVTDISGRGVGLAAVRAETHRLGGRVSVEARSGRGTTLQFVFPVSALGEAYATEPQRAAA